MLAAEVARSVLFYAAAQLEKSDRGDEEARRRVRVLTPLLKFRACRDARKVTGDAMEVRGGCGYIEEWSDGRLLRDAHLGSIWEGTSNIVALDVLRAIRKEDALSALPFDDPFFSRAAAFAEKAGDEDARQAATGLYYAIAAAIMAQEGEKLAHSGDARRLLLSRLVTDHKLSPRDPFAAVDCPYAEALLSEDKIPLDAAKRYLG
jgi:acyl-CoA dehydrogenase